MGFAYGIMFCFEFKIVSTFQLCTDTCNQFRLGFLECPMCYSKFTGDWLCDAYKVYLECSLQNELLVVEGMTKGLLSYK